MIAAVKHKIANFLIERKARSISRNREFVNLSEAYHVGIVAYIDNKNTYKIIDEFKDYLRTDENVNYINTFYFVPLKSLSTEYQNTQWKTFVCLSDLNFLGLPKKSLITDFLDKYYDILIDLSFSDALPVRYVVASANARLKVGPYMEQKNKYYDLIINMKGSNDLKVFIETLVTLLISVNQRR